MNRNETLLQLKHYIANRILDGKELGLDENTPLLEWGIINSLEIVQIISFIQQTFGIDIPDDRIIADNFMDLNAITNMVLASSPVRLLD